ncbi:aspartate kinase [Bhargavaea ullalensis]|uniref:Aspartokinase n=2 Tax=Bhargavaea ullalensis TaxID=1265685 RepID=A0ABV2GES9_9BACL
MGLDEMKVCKFGGTSVASAQQIMKVAGLISSDPSRRIVVVSAPGKRHPEDPKVTDLLIRLADAALDGKDTDRLLSEVVDRFRSIADDLGLAPGFAGTVEQDLRSRLGTDRPDAGRFLDLMKAAGEDNNARLVAAYLNQIGVEAVYMSPKEAGLIVEGPAGDGMADVACYEQLSRLKDDPRVIVFPGFFGFTKDGVLCTFGRGGSDITGSILAAATDADLYENFTDVDGVFAANPNVVDRPALIGKMTYREMRELAYNGFNVLHDESLMPAFLKSVPVNIRNTNNPSAPGTLIVRERNCKTQPVIGIAADSGFSTLFVDKYLMNREIGFGRKLLGILEDENISFEHTPSGIDNLSVIIRNKFLTPEKEERILRRCYEELKVDHAHLNSDYSMIVLVGEAMRHTKGLAARAAMALAGSGTNIEMINQGSSEVSIVFGVHKSDEKKALRAVYEEFFVPSAVPSF